MKVKSDMEANVIAWEISKAPIDHAKEVGHAIIHFSAGGAPVYIEVLEANKFITKSQKAFRAVPSVGT